MSINLWTLEKYASQFKYEPMNVFIVTIELDMTQTQSKNGILKYIIRHEKGEDVATIRTDGEYTNIAYDNVDINKTYRLAVSLNCCKESWCELID